MKIARRQQQPAARRGDRGVAGLPLTKATVHRFADMEVFVEIHENVRGEDVFIIQSTSYPANDNLMELLVIIDALRRASARRITAVMPYFGYARQDRKTGPAHPDLGQAGRQPDHRGRRQPRADDGAARRPDPGLLRHPGRQPLRRAAVRAATSRRRYAGRNLIIVSPDVGGVVRARGFAKRLDADLAIIDKRRERAGVSEVMNVIGEVEAALHPGRRHRGQRRHPLQRGRRPDRGRRPLGPAPMSPTACCRAAPSRGSRPVPIEMLVITDSIRPTEAVRLASNVKQLSIAPLIADAMDRIHGEKSVSSLFD